MRAQYDPWTGLISGCQTAYEDFHEHAHLEQHVRRTACWQLMERLRGTPLGAATRLAVEVEAWWMARREMKRCRIWWMEDVEQAAEGLLQHLIFLIFEKNIASL